MKNLNNIIQLIQTVFQLVLFALISQAALADNDTPQEFNKEYYHVMDGKVDPATFIGWNVFHHVCVGCHGVGAVGSELAPDLTRSINKLSPDQFNIKVLHKYAVRFTTDDWRDIEQAMFEEILKQEQRDSGELTNMPRWENNPVVRENVQNIYRYLKARSDGVIGPGKPEILKE